MRHEKPTEEIRELAAFYSLGALTQHEADSFETHMREGCPVCRDAYFKFKHITAEIGFAAGEVAAPDYIRELILARIERETAASRSDAEPDAGTIETQAPAPQAEAETAARTTSAARPVLSQPAPQRSNVFPWILPAILLVAAVLIFYTYRQEKKITGLLRGEIATAQSDIQDLQTLLKIEKGRRGELEQIMTAVSKPETRILHLAGLPPAPTASGAILWDAQLNQCLVFGYMPPPPQGKSYQLWFITPTAKIPSGSPKPDPAGRIYDSFPVPGEITSMSIVITLEPDGNSKVPTLPFYAIGRND